MSNSNAAVMTFDEFRESLASESAPAEIAALKSLAIKVAKRVTGPVFRSMWNPWCIGA